MRFAKMHGLGNDFVLLDLRDQPDGAPPSTQRASELCDRHRGIGADGVLTLLAGDRFVIQNADGSVPEMCGNGARCAALWIATARGTRRSEEHTSELQSRFDLVCRLLLEKKKKTARTPGVTASTRSGRTRLCAAPYSM